MSVWSTLKFNTTAPVNSALSSFHQVEFFRRSPKLEYRNPRSQSIFVHIAKRAAMLTARQEINKVAASWLDSTAAGAARRKRLEDNVRRIKQNRDKLIERQNVIADGDRNGVLQLADIGYKVVAMDKYGARVPEALILHYDDENESLTFVGYKPQGDQFDLNSVEEYTTKTWFHIDLSPEISVSSSKNVILTTVQGRDYTRKELVSGGDLHFSVSGSINSNEPGVYPSEAVRKFVKMMKYGGIIEVNSFQFNQLNVDRILIKDWRLGAPSCKNIQPYSFDCVAIEPDEEISGVKDTIAQVNDMIQEQVYTQSVNYMAILKQKALQFASDAVVQGAGFGLDELTKNI